MKKKNILLLIIALIIIIATVAWAMNEIKLIKVKAYSNLEEFDYQSQIEEDGHISKINALKLASMKDKDYIRRYGLSDVSIELMVDKNNQKYWSVQLTYYDNSNGYACGVYGIDYYTGEILTSDDEYPPTPSNIKTTHTTLYY